MRTITTKSNKILADTYTPVSIYLKLRDVYPKSVLLESTDFHHLENCYSFICIKPIAEFVVQEERLYTTTQEEKTLSTDIGQIAIIKELQRFINSFRPNEYSPSFNGFFGYISYNAVKYFETVQLKERNENDSIPDIYYSLYKYVIAFNHLKNEITLIENLLGNDSSELNEVEQVIKNGKLSQYPFANIGNEESDLTDDQFKALVSKAKEHCNRGDVIQLVISRRFTQAFQGDDFNVYRQLRTLNPSPYLFYFDYGNFRLFGSSPESQIEIKKNSAYINPIAGTYPRSGDDETDKQQALTLSQDTKENAEHVMLVDLARNDLSKHCSQVKVENYKEIHFYSHVIHIVSKVSGELKDNSKNLKVIADSFPAGTLTGAPKYKAMQLIDKYEPTERGFYGGCIGMISFNGDVNHAITIRSFLSKSNSLHYQAGAGIVSKSVENKELQEVNHKLGALKAAIQKATSDSFELVTKN